MNNMDKNQIILEAQLIDYSEYDGAIYEINSREEMMKKWLKVEFIDDYEPPMFLYRDKSFHIRYANAHLDPECYEIFFRNAPPHFFKDIDFAKAIILVHPNLSFYFDTGLRTKKEFILSFLKGIAAMTTNEQLSAMRSYLYCDNRITTAYEICKSFPEYQIRFGAELRKKLNGQNIVKYVETRALFKKLDKEVPQKIEVTRRTKI